MKKASTHAAMSRRIVYYARQKIELSVSAGSFNVLISQNNSSGSRKKNEPMWRSRHVLDAMFLNSWSQGSFTRSQSSSTSLFCLANIR